MQALDEADCRELVHALSGPASSEGGPSSEADTMLVGPPTALHLGL